MCAMLGDQPCALEGEIRVLDDLLADGNDGLRPLRLRLDLLRGQFFLTQPFKLGEQVVVEIDQSIFRHDFSSVLRALMASAWRVVG